MSKGGTFKYDEKCAEIPSDTSHGENIDHTVAVYSWSIANNFVIGFYCRCLEILCRIAFSNVANYYRFYRKK